jgi:hypothetical protein
MNHDEILDQLRQLAGHPPDDAQALRVELVALVFALDEALYPAVEPSR